MEEEAKENEETEKEELEELTEEAELEEESKIIEEETEKGEETEEEIGRIEEEEVEEAPAREKEEEEVFIEERIYTVPLQRASLMAPKKRAPKAISILKAFIQRHMKVGEVVIEEEAGEERGKIIISNEVNEKIWCRGIEKPPRKLRIRAAKDEEGNVTVFLA